MTTKVEITIRPSAEHPDYLTIHDAMQQVLDVFVALRGGITEEFDWRLVSATTNSPLTIVGEFFPTQDFPPAVIASASHMVVGAYQALEDALAGDEPVGDIDLHVVKRLLARNLNGIGLTEIRMEGQPLVAINPERAHRALDVFKAAGLASAPKRVRGSLEGELVYAGSYRKQPALRLRERTKGRILWCRIPEEYEGRFAEATSLDDVWRDARVRLRGWIEYSRSGEIAGMSAEGIQRIKPRDISPTALRDPGFTEGLESVNYLDKLRDGDLG